VTRARLPLGLALFLAFQGLYALTASGRVSRVPDEFEVYLQVESLWDRGSLAIPQVPPAAFFGRIGRDGLPYAPYGPGVAFTALPHHALGRAVAAAAGIPRAPEAVAAWTETVAAFTSLATSTWGALAVLGLYGAARALGAGRGRAARAAVALGVGTVLWPYATLFFSEAVAAAGVAAALAFHLRGRLVPAALVVGGLVLLKGTNGILAPAFLALAAGEGAGGDRSPRARAWGAAAYAVAAAAAVAVHLAWNAARFGDALAFGYDWGEMVAGDPRPFDPATLPRGLLGLLLAPGKSLLLFAPVVGLAAWRWPATLRRRPGLAAAWAVGLGASLLFYGSYFYWEGGYAFGPRHLVPLLPLLVLPLALGPPPPRRAFGGLVVAGACVGLLGSTASFMEDQAMGARVTEDGRSASPYYAYAPDAPPGSPRNVYRLGYAPWLRSARRLARYTVTPAAEVEVGLGLELLRPHLVRVRARYPGGGAIPAWLPWLGTLLGAAPFGLGAGALLRAGAGRRR